jgi:hypothetical protein
MLENKNKVEFPTKGGSKVEMEINFSSDKDKVKIIVDGREGIISKKDLYPFVFVIADEETQSKLMPVQRTTIRKYVKQHRVELLKDMKKGDVMVVNCEVDVPLTVEQGLSGIIDNKKRSKLITL